MFTGYTCICCNASQPKEFEGYICPDCGGNLDITYDYAAIRNRGLEQLFSRKVEGIGRFIDLLPVTDPEHLLPLRVGDSPLYPADRLAQAAGMETLFLKEDGLNPSGSFKDRASAVALARAHEIGAQIVVGASTGNAGSSMACMAASVGLPCVIFVPEKAPAAKLAQLLIFGAHVIAVRGTYDEAFDLCMEVCAERGWFNRNTGHNPFTREGKKTSSFEICEQHGWNPPDRIIVPTGDGNIISGIWKGLKDLFAVGLIDRLPKIDCAQATGSAAVTRAVNRLKTEHDDVDSIDWSSVSIAPVKADTVADSISVDQPRDGLAAVRAVLESGGNAIAVDDQDLLAAMVVIARLAGVFTEPSSAASWAALKKGVAGGLIRPEERVVCLLTGSGLKDVDGARRVTGKPHVIDPTLSEASRIIETLPL